MFLEEDKNEVEDISFTEDEMILPEDFEEISDSEAIDNEVATEQASEVETSNSNNNEQLTDEQRLLNYLNAKEIKYNGQPVKVDSLDKFIDTFQKGMNYDNLKAKQEKSENVVMNYVTDMARKMNLTPEQYIEKVKAFEKEQEKAKIESQVQNMMDRGIDEETAKSVAETRAYMETLKNEKAEFEKQKAEMEAQKNKDKEYEDFLKEYPEVKADEIPAEVFENAKTMGLKSAYAQYENKLLKQEIKTLKQNVNNASSSVVSATSNGSSTEQQSKDAFLLGFDEI